MKIALCNGGLGNQTFQYIFSRYIELAGGEPCYLDNSAFCGEHVMHNGFEIPKVFPNAKPRLLSDCFTEDVWRYMAEKGNVIQQLRDAGEDFVLVSETPDFHYDGKVMTLSSDIYFPSLATLVGDIYFHGYWVNKGWLTTDSEIEAVLRRELAFAPIEDEQNKRYEEAIENTLSVALHVRRGDCVELRCDTPIENYRMAVDFMKEKLKQAHFFVFSDDIDWCKENREGLGLGTGEVTFVEGNDRDGRNYIDMQLMSCCKAVILVHLSSFSYLAALLNRNSEVQILNLTPRDI